VQVMASIPKQKFALSGRILFAVLLSLMVLVSVFFVAGSNVYAAAVDYNALYGPFSQIYTSFTSDTYACKQAGLSHITTSLAVCVDSILDSVSRWSFDALNGKFAIFIKIAAYFTIVFLAIKILLGAGTNSLAEGFIVLFKIFIVMTIGLGSPDTLMEYSQLVRGFGRELGAILLERVASSSLASRIQAIALNPASTPGGFTLVGYEVFVGMDQMIAVITGYCDPKFGDITLGPCGGGSGGTRVALQVAGLAVIIGIIIASGGTGLTLLAAVLLLLLSLVMMIIEVMMVYISSMIALTLLFIALPIIIPFLLLPQTEGIVKKWFESVMVYALVPVMLLGSVALFYGVIGVIPSYLGNFYSELLYSYADNWTKDAKRQYKTTQLITLTVPIDIPGIPGLPGLPGIPDISIPIGAKLVPAQMSMNETCLPPVLPFVVERPVCPDPVALSHPTAPVSGASFSEVTTWAGAGSPDVDATDGTYVIPVEKRVGVTVDVVGNTMEIFTDNAGGEFIFADAAGYIERAWSRPAEVAICARAAVLSSNQELRAQCSAARASGVYSASNYDGAPFVQITHAAGLGTSTVYVGLAPNLLIQPATQVRQGQNIGRLYPVDDALKVTLHSGTDPAAGVMNPGTYFSLSPSDTAAAKALCEKNIMTSANTGCGWNPLCRLKEVGSAARVAWNMGGHIFTGYWRASGDFLQALAAGPSMAALKEFVSAGKNIVSGYMNALSELIGALPESVLAWIFSKCITVPFLGGMAVMKLIIHFCLPALGVALLLQAMYSVAKQMPEIAQTMIGQGVFAPLPMGGVQLSRQVQAVAASVVNIGVSAAKGAATGGKAGAIKGAARAAIKTVGDVAKVASTIGKGTKG
jgi:hypothetical protein